MQLAKHPCWVPELHKQSLAGGSMHSGDQVPAVSFKGSEPWGTSFETGVKLAGNIWKLITDDVKTHWEFSVIWFVFLNHSNLPLSLCLCLPLSLINLILSLTPAMHLLLHFAFLAEPSMLKPSLCLHSHIPWTSFPSDKERTFVFHPVINSNIPSVIGD